MYVSERLPKRTRSLHRAVQLFLDIPQIRRGRRLWYSIHPSHSFTNLFKFVVKSTKNSGLSKLTLLPSYRGSFVRPCSAEKTIQMNTMFIISWRLTHIIQLLVPFTTIKSWKGRQNNQVTLLHVHHLVIYQSPKPPYLSGPQRRFS